MRRWPLRLLLVFVLLITLALIAVQLVLRSDLPRRLVIEAVEARTGLQVDAASLDTGWLGRTTIRDLTISLPLANQPLLDVPELRAEHAGLLRFLLTRDLALASFTMREPLIRIEATRDGEWNVVEAAQLIAGNQSSRDNVPGASVSLPKISITGGVVELHPPDGGVQRYTPLTVSGKPDGGGAWRGDVAVKPHLTASAEFVAGGKWKHNITFDVQSINSIIAPWLPEAPDRLHVTGRWQGEIHNDTVTAQLRLDELAAERATVRGDLNVSIQGTTAAIEPREVNVELADSPIDSIRLAGGRVRSNGMLTTIERLLVNTLSAHIQVDGRWSRTEEVASLTAQWQGELHGETTHRGTLDANARLPGVGPVHLAVHGRSEGHGDLGTWTTRWEGNARGEDWTTLTGSVLAPELTWSRGEQGVDLGGLSADFVVAWPLARIEKLRALDNVLTGHGQLDTSSQSWRIALAADDWQPSARFRHPSIAAFDDRIPPVTMDVAARGQAAHAVLERLEVLAANIVLRASGSYEPKQPTPLQLQVAFEAPLERLNTPGLTGHTSTEATINGSVTDDALALRINGATTIKHARWRERDMKTVVVPWRSELDDQRINLETDAFALLNGKWTATGRYDFETERAAMTLQSTGAAVDHLVTLIDAPIEMRGELDLDSSLEITRFDPETLMVEGTWHARELHAPMLQAADGRGRIDVRDGIINFHEITISADDRQLAGEARFALDQPAIVDVNGRLTNWPITIAETGLTMVVDGVIEGQADLELRELRGGFGAHADLILAGEQLGWAELRGDLDAMTANITEMHAELLNGTVDGGGRVILDLARWMESTMHLDWANLDLKELTTKFDRPGLKLEAMTGRMHGRLAAGPSTDHRAPEPWRFDLSATFDDAAYDAIPLGRSRASPATNEGEERAAVEAVSESDMTVRGYAGAERVLIDAARLAIADGFIDLWGRVSAHGDEHAAHLHAELRDLDLQPFALVAGLDERPMPGRISGSVSVGGYLQAPHRLFGGSRLSLRESDLAALPFISLIFDTLRLSFGQTEPTGKGEAVIRLEGDRLELSRLTYFNRGTDIVAQIAVEDLTRGFNSPVRGVAAGGVRPLRDVELPFFDQLDRVIEALQRDAASVRIDGTVGALETRVVPFSEILGAIGRVLGGN